MTIHDLASHKNFVPAQRGAAFVSAQRGITIYDAPLSPSQRAEVKRRLAATWPAIAGCQTIQNGGKFRIQPVRGATIPHDCTDADVLAVVQVVTGEAIDPTLAVLQPDKVTQ